MNSMFFKQVSQSLLIVQTLRMLNSFDLFGAIEPSDELNLNASEAFFFR